MPFVLRCGEAVSWRPGRPRRPTSRCARGRSPCDRSPEPTPESLRSPLDSNERASSPRSTGSGPDDGHVLLHPRRPGDLATMLDERSQGIVELVGVLVGQVDLISTVLE